jgi:3-hydroxyisobutyrate dehydrogenase-like beta-hydroxyacid dehydrogenase
MMVKKVYEPVMISNQLFAKDIALIGDAVNKTGVYTPLFREAAALYGLVNECERLRHEDSASVHSFLEQKSSP